MEQSSRLEQVTIDSARQSDDSESSDNKIADSAMLLYIGLREYGISSLYSIDQALLGVINDASNTLIEATGGYSKRFWKSFIEDKKISAKDFAQFWYGISDASNIIHQENTEENAVQNSRYDARQKKAEDLEVKIAKSSDIAKAIGKTFFESYIGSIYDKDMGAKKREYAHTLSEKLHTLTCPKSVALLLGHVAPMPFPKESKKIFAYVIGACVTNGLSKRTNRYQLMFAHLFNFTDEVGNITIKDIIKGEIWGEPVWGNWTAALTMFGAASAGSYISGVMSQETINEAAKVYVAARYLWSGMRMINNKLGRKDLPHPMIYLNFTNWHFSIPLLVNDRAALILEQKRSGEENLVSKIKNYLLDRKKDVAHIITNDPIDISQEEVEKDSMGQYFKEEGLMSRMQRGYYMTTIALRENRQYYMKRITEFFRRGKADT